MSQQTFFCAVHQENALFNTYVNFKILFCCLYQDGILVVCDFALVFALAPISPMLCHFFALALALYFTYEE